MRIVPLGLTVLLGFWASLHAEVLPLSGDGDARIRVATYDPDEVYRLYAVVGFDLRLEFAPDERFVTVDGGDLDAITYSTHDNVFSFKPRVQGANTNLAITTSRHSYYFQYSAVRESELDGTQPRMYVVRFRYPPDPASPESRAKQQAERVDRDLAQAEQGRPRNTDYWYCGDPSIKPVAASDDGVHTRLRFAPRSELPALFVRASDGSESLLNFSLEAGDVVIHRVAAQFVIRRGKLTGCIVNKGFLGGGTRLDSGTVSPAVERSTRTPRP